MLSVARFNRQLRRQGQDVTWARAALCPCRDPDTGGARPGCPVCHGKAVIWSAPVPSHTGVSGQKVQREWVAFGQYESGDVVVSIPSDTPFYAAGESDRVVFVQSSEPFDVVHTRGASTERFLWTAVRFDRCFWLRPDGGGVIEGGAPVQAADRSVSWPAGRLAPPLGTQYTLTGRKRPEYFMFKELMQDRAHYGGLALPRRCVLRKWDLFGR